MSALTMPRPRRRPRIRPARIAFWALVGAGLALVGFFTLFPFLWMALSSLKPLSEIYLGGFWPTAPTLANYEVVFTEFNVPRAFVNSLWMSTAATLLTVFFSTLGGYAFAKLPFPGRERLLAVILATMAVPFFVLMVPMYIYLRSVFDWINTPWPIIVPFAASAFGIFLMRQYLLAIPDEILDAGRVDGAGEFGLFRRIVVPMVVPGMASLGLITFVGTWNGFMWAKAVLQAPELETLPLLLTRIERRTEYFLPPFDLLMAGSTISVIPTIVLVLVLWRRFGVNIVSGAVKG